MSQSNHSSRQPWPQWQKLAFRFFFIYFSLHIMPLGWIADKIPGLRWVMEQYGTFMDWFIAILNRAWFHYAANYTVNNGSGDTSAAWEEMWTFLVLAVTGMLVWSILDRKRKSYATLNYWLRTFLRYFIILNCFSYGVNKLFALQMPFPNLSQLATPLGDFLPMRFSWMFIGYSKTYEVFSGAMEVFAGLLLLNRRTITLGLFIGTVVFMNVMILNLCYDIPVKIYSIHLTVYCLYLLSNDFKRLFDFFILNKAVAANHIHENHFPKKWMKITRIIFKLAFIILFVIIPFFEMNDFYQTREKTNNTETKPISSGVYDVITFAVNKDTLLPSATDTVRWKDVIFDRGYTGSVGSQDDAFRQRYRRGYFSVSVDSTNRIRFKKSATSDMSIAIFQYSLPDSNTVKLWGSKGSDSLYVLLRKSKRHFQLAERQFHWISEANR